MDERGSVAAIDCGTNSTRLLVADATLLVLFSREDHVGIAVTFGLAAACVPFVWLARRANFRLRSAGM